mmetsp:Transcript_34525/g.86728  ORF Transcript_34525/g.86728 Transcript_34525/m.86728 type:complete len:449 (-) Transcript_34525:1107-2453(-)
MDEGGGPLGELTKASSARGVRRVRGSVNMVLLGSSKTGKTCFLKTYLGLGNTTTFSIYKPTVLDHFTLDVTAGSCESVKFSIFDVGGGSVNLLELCLKAADIVLLCFSVDDPLSLDEATRNWLQEVRHLAPTAHVVLVGLRSDARKAAKGDHTLIPPDRCRDVAARLPAPYFEASCRSRDAVQAVFRHAVEWAVASQPWAHRGHKRANSSITFVRLSSPRTVVPTSPTRSAPMQQAPPPPHPKLFDSGSDRCAASLLAEHLDGQRRISTHFPTHAVSSEHQPYCSPRRSFLADLLHSASCEEAKKPSRDKDKGLLSRFNSLLDPGRRRLSLNLGHSPFHSPVSTLTANSSAGSPADSSTGSLGSTPLPSPRHARVSPASPLPGSSLAPRAHTSKGGGLTRAKSTRMPSSPSLLPPGWSPKPPPPPPPPMAGAGEAAAAGAAATGVAPR